MRTPRVSRLLPASLLMITSWCSTAAPAATVAARARPPAGDVSPRSTNPLTNGAVHNGTIELGDLDSWTIEAASGDALEVRVGEVTGTVTFAPYVQLYDPSGALVKSASGAADAYVVYRATLSGEYTAVVSSYYSGQTGTYEIFVVKAPGTLVVSDGDEGGPLTNGGVHAGSITMGDLDAWTISATSGDSLEFRAGELTGSPTFAPYLRLYDPAGALVASDSDGSDAYVTFRTTLTGVYTVVMTSYYSGQTGSYELHAAKAPGTISVPDGDEGGPLTNGGAHEGTITLGDLDEWTITAAGGDALEIRAGELSGTASFAPYLRLYDPAGKLVESNADGADAYVTYRATLAGEYTVVIGSYYAGHTGMYRLHAVKSPGTLTVPANDEGGALTNGGVHAGTITIGDLDAWTITAASGDSLDFRAGELTGTASFAPYLRLYDPAGKLVESRADGADAYVTYRASLAGVYTVVVSAYYAGHTGTYQLHAVKSPGTTIVADGDEGGKLSNGAVHEGEITIGDLDAWWITAAAGDSLEFRAGEVSGTAGFAPYIRLYDPSGALVSSKADGNDAYVSYRATLPGVYVAVVSTYYAGDTGTYRLQVVKAPGKPIISSDDEGGPLLKSGVHEGSLFMGDLDSWTITAATGDSLDLRAAEVTGTAGFAPYLRLYDPAGVLVKQNTGTAEAVVSHKITLTGTYTVVVTSYYAGETGTYKLNSSLIEYNDPPSISRIADQKVAEDKPTRVLAFTISDPETSASRLKLSRRSSNTRLVPTKNIVLTGTGRNRTVKIVPAANRSGTATITLTVSDGKWSRTSSFKVTVTSVNDAPTITAIRNQNLKEDKASARLPFTIADVETSASKLKVTVDSSNRTLLPVSGIALAGTGSSRTVKVTPARNRHGSATVTISVSDGRLTTRRTFKVTVSSVNDAPTISKISNQTIAKDARTGVLRFKVGDAETSASKLTISRKTSNSRLVPTSGIALGGSGSNRTVRVTPAADREGTVTVTLTVSDGKLRTSTSFKVTVGNVSQSSTDEEVHDAGITDRMVRAGGDVTFAIGAEDESASIQWFHDEERIAGARAASLELKAVKLTDAGGYHAVVATAKGARSTRTAELTVLEERAIAVHSARDTVNVVHTLQVAGESEGLRLTVLLPAGWTYVGGTVAQAQMSPAAGDTGLLEWRWRQAPVGVMKLEYQLQALPGGPKGGELEGLIDRGESTDEAGVPVVVPIGPPKSQ